MDKRLFSTSSSSINDSSARKIQTNHSYVTSSCTNGKIITISNDQTQKSFELDYHVISDFLKNLQELCEPNEHLIICEFYQNAKPKFYAYNTSFKLNPHANIYYTINPRVINSTEALTGQGRKEDIKHVIALYADLDVKSDVHADGTFTTKEEAFKKLREFPLKPTYTIDSGYGLQALWLLREPLTLNEDIDLEEFEAINRGLQKFLNADTTADISRIFRLPGTFNNKNPEQPILVEIIEATKKRYTIDDFNFITPVYRTSTHDYTLNTQLTTTLVDLTRLSDRILSIIRFGCDPRNPSKTDRSELIQSVVTAMIANKYSDDEVFSVLTDPGYKISEKILEKRSDHERKRYVALSIAKAKAYIEENGKHQERKIASNHKRVELPFQVLGFTTDKKIYVWYHGQLINFNARQLTRDELALFCGYLETKEFRELKKVILTEAHKKDIIDADETRKSGIWKVSNGFLIISGKDVLHITDVGIRRIHEPVWGKKILNLNDQPWLNPEKLEECLVKANITDTFKKLHDLIAQWTFEDGQMIPYLTAFVMLAPFQHAMRWRPWVYLTGRRGTGKTTFFQEVLGIFGNLTIKMDKTTAHALLQEIGSTGKIPVLDEFEKYRKIEEILELAKSANSAEAIHARGTTGEKARKWSLHHMFWFGSIYPAGTDAAQQSRMVVFELLPHGDDTLKLLTLAEKEELKHEIIACILKKWNEIEEQARKYQERKTEYRVKDGRIIDNLCYASAVVDVATGEGGIPEFAERIDFEEDEEKLLTTILLTVVEGERIYDRLESNIAHTCEKYGLKKVTYHGQEHLAIDTSQVQRYLLKDTMWHELDITKPLLRLSSTRRRETVKLSGKSRRAVLISWELVQNIMGELEENA